MSISEYHRGMPPAASHRRIASSCTLRANDVQHRPEVFCFIHNNGNAVRRGHGTGR